MTDVAKAGWLMRQSSVLKRWKKEWFALSIDGYLRHFENPNKLRSEDTLHMPTDAMRILVGSDVDTSAPSGRSNDSLIKIQTRDSDWILCAENVDEMLAWQMALEQARVMNRREHMRQPYQPIPSHLREVLAHSNNRYPMYYRGTYRGTFPSRIVNTPNGPITVVYIDQPYRYGYYNSDDSVLCAAAVASCLLWPFWFPIFWCF